MTEHINEAFFEDTRALFEEDFSGLVQQYIGNSTDKVEQLRMAQNQADNNKGYDLAHALKGASSNLGLTQLGNLCAQLEQVCRNNSIDSATDLIAQIQAEVILTNALMQARL